MSKNHVTRGWSAAAKLAYYTDRGAPDECWPWQGRRNEDGYGVVTVAGRAVRANRAALEEKLGRPLTDAERACHTCDNPPCGNPDHLFAGTQGANVADMRAKGRGKNPVLPGQKNGRALLSAGDVIAIRRDPRSARFLAAEHGVSLATIHKARSGENWAHLQVGEYEEPWS